MLCFSKIGETFLICGCRSWDRVDASTPEECPIHKDRDRIECDGSNECRTKPILHLQPTTDGRAERPAEVPCHAGEACNRGSP